MTSRSFTDALRYSFVLIALVSAAGLAACTDSPTEPSPEAVSTTVASTSEDPEGQAFLRDFVAVRGAVDLATWQNYEGLYYAAVDHAHRLDWAEGAAFLRRELPPLLANVVAEGRDALAGVQAVVPETSYGEQLRELEMAAITFDVESFQDLDDRFAGIDAASEAGSEWVALELWSRATSPRIEELDRQLVLFYEGLPGPFREALERGMRAFAVGSSYS